MDGIKGSVRIRDLLPDPAERGGRRGTSIPTVRGAVARMAAVTISSRAPSVRSVSAYYQLYSALFRSLSDDSGFMNLGWTEPGGRVRSVSEIQFRLVGRVAEAAGFKTTHGPGKGEGPAVLDVGCGFLGPAGVLASVFGCRVTGLDPGKEQREEWKSRGPVPFIRPSAGTADHLPFRDGAFDCVISIESAFHYPDKPAFLREARRVLHADGRFLLADILQAPVRGLPGRIAAFFGEALSSGGFFDARSYEKAAAEAGLRLVRFEDWSSGVSRSCPLWSRVLFRRWRRLRREYSAVTLLKIGLSLRFFPAAFRALGFRYALFVFEPAGETGIRDRGRP
jgi:cyclopropane fatty-acyl-phospholipid synthase-like methyltransferase